MRESFKTSGSLSKVYGVANRDLPKLTAKQRLDFFWCRLGKHHDFVETPPQGRVQKPLVVGRGHGECLRSETIEHLKEGVHNTFKLPVLVGSRSVLADGIKLVKEKDQGTAPCEIENLPQVGSRLAKIRGHHSVESHRGKRKVKLAGKCFRGNRLTAPRRSTEQDLGKGGTPCAPRSSSLRRSRTIRSRVCLTAVAAWVAEAGLTLHPTKTRVVEAGSEGFDFLGYHFRGTKHWPRKKSLAKLKETLRDKTKRTNGTSLGTIIGEVNRAWQGWFVYFKHSLKTTFGPIDSWVRMRLRSILRKRKGRRGRGRGRDHQRWPNRFFAEHGLYSLVEAHARFCQSSTR